MLHDILENASISIIDTTKHLTAGNVDKILNVLCDNFAALQQAPATAIPLADMTAKSITQPLIDTIQTIA